MNKIREEAISKAEVAAIERMESELPSMVAEYWSLVKNYVDASEADAIANVQEDGKDDNG